MFSVQPPRSPYDPPEPPMPKPVPGSRTRPYATLAVGFLLASFIMANLAITANAASSAMCIWYALMGIFTGLMGVVMTVATINHHFSWD